MIEDARGYIIDLTKVEMVGPIIQDHFRIRPHDSHQRKGTYTVYIGAREMLFCDTEEAAKGGKHLPRKEFIEKWEYAKGTQPAKKQILYC